MKLTIQAKQGKQCARTLKVNRVLKIRDCLTSYGVVGSHGSKIIRFYGKTHPSIDFTGFLLDYGDPGSNC